jgi:hypothetical protein
MYWWSSLAMPDAIPAIMRGMVNFHLFSLT